MIDEIKKYLSLVEMMDDNYEISIVDRNSKNPIVQYIRLLYRTNEITTNHYHVAADEIFTRSEIMEILEDIGFLQEKSLQYEVDQNSHAIKMLDFLSGYFEGKELNSGEYKNPPLPPRMY